MLQCMRNTVKLCMPYQRRVIKLLNRGKEGVHVHVDPGACQICSCPQLRQLAVHCPASTQQSEWEEGVLSEDTEKACGCESWIQQLLNGGEKAPYPGGLRCVQGLHPVLNPSTAVSCPDVTWAVRHTLKCIATVQENLCALRCVPHLHLPSALAAHT